MAWDRLIAKYAPKTAPSLLKLKKKFANSRLESAEKHPDEWITELESICNDIEAIPIATRMSDMDFMIHILNNLPELYDVVLDGMENRLMLSDSDPNKLTIENVRDKLNNRFERLDEREKVKDANDYALKAWTRQYKGTCANCGEYGHPSKFCPKKEKEGQFQGVCFICGKKGHLAKDCKHRKKETKADPQYKCFLCGEKGHYEKDCPKRPEYGKEKGFLARGESESDSEYSVGCDSFGEPRYL